MKHFYSLFVVLFFAVLASAHFSTTTSDGLQNAFEVVSHGDRRMSLRPISRPRDIVNKDYQFSKEQSDNNVAAAGTYNDTLMSIGWNVLTVVTNPALPDWEQAYAAGFYEGAQTYALAREFLSNAVPKINSAEGDFLDQNIAWVKSQSAANKATDPYWEMISLILEQWEGMLDGMNYQITINKDGANMTQTQLMQISSYGDLFDIQPALNPSMRGDWWNKVSKKDFRNWKLKNSHCSSLFKIVGNFDDIFFGHATWNVFNSMNRIFKHITLNFNKAAIAAKTVSMSSYPGIISSLDDFYVMSSGMVAIETSLSVINTTIYDGNIKPQSLLYWFRVMAANRMATDSPSWAKYFSVDNSGTYNNQWMVLNTNLFTPGQDLKLNTFWVVEQMPGKIAALDYTTIFRYGYYPSYNVVMNRELFIYSGGQIAVDKEGPEMNDYQMCVRAQIFRRDQGTVTDMKSFKHIMQYNDYENDPVSQGNPLYAIASRVDLDPFNPMCFGALDAKVGSIRHLREHGMQVHAYSGPTPQQPFFEFNTTRAVCGPHVGVPEAFNFQWTDMTP